jgi:hypothetical protein
MSIAAEYVDALSRALQKRHVVIEPGLSQAEISRVEDLIDAPMPPELRSLLGALLPVSDRFPNWRDGDEERLRSHIDEPIEGVVDFVEHHDFWFDGWGQRPGSLSSAIAIARENLVAAPKLIPVYGHRYLPCQPAIEGNPVFSIMSTDVVVYGNDLADYISHEFKVLAPSQASRGPRYVSFWSDLAR